VDAKGAIIDLGDGIEGQLKASEIGRDRVEDARNALRVDDKVEAQIINIDRKNRVINLSVKAKDSSDERAAVKAHKRQDAEAMPNTTIGDLIKAQMDSADR